MLSAIADLVLTTLLKIVIWSSSSVFGIPLSLIAPHAKLTQNAAPTTANVIGNVMDGSRYHGTSCPISPSNNPKKDEL